MESKTAPDIIKQAKDNEWFHVFFTVNPVTSIIFRMIAEKYLLPKEKIIVFSFRDTDTRIIDFNPTIWSLRLPFVLARSLFVCFTKYLSWRCFLE